jgi:hypothetical protein
MRFESEFKVFFGHINVDLILAVYCFEGLLEHFGEQRHGPQPVGIEQSLAVSHQGSLDRGK